jgi:hypothetical protein
MSFSNAGIVYAAVARRTSQRDALCDMSRVRIPARAPSFFMQMILLQNMLMELIDCGFEGLLEMLYELLFKLYKTH